MNYNLNKVKGIALKCTIDGKIKAILHDGLGLSKQFPIGGLFIHGLDEGSQSKGLNFIENIKKDHAAFDWEMNLDWNKRIEIIHFSGFYVEDNLLLIGVKAWKDMEKLIKEISLINNEISSHLRDLIKEMNKSEDAIKRVDDEFDEISRLNSELTNTQRELIKKNLQLKKALEDKDLLLKEIYHRVKNNLMVISSLLSLQSQYIKDKEALASFRESENRAKSMALIHERLYRSTDLKQIDFGEFIRTFSYELYQSIVADPSKVTLELNVESIKLDINASIPLGLIVNELITNSMKYAFPEGRKGTINIDFYGENDYFVLKIADNGVGIPLDIDIYNTSTLGLRLVHNLTEQIDGTLELNRENGTSFKIIFPEMKFN